MQSLIHSVVVLIVVKPEKKKNSRFLLHIIDLVIRVSLFLFLRFLLSFGK